MSEPQLAEEIRLLDASPAVEAGVFGGKNP
jgi:hypothetical protein